MRVKPSLCGLGQQLYTVQFTPTRDSLSTSKGYWSYTRLSQDYLPSHIVQKSHPHPLSCLSVANKELTKTVMGPSSIIICSLWGCQWRDIETWGRRRAEHSGPEHTNYPSSQPPSSSLKEPIVPPPPPPQWGSPWANPAVLYLFIRLILSPRWCGVVRGGVPTRGNV